MKKLCSIVAVMCLLCVSGCLFGGGGLSRQDKLAITLSAMDAGELSIRAESMSCDDPNTCAFLKASLAEAARALDLAQHTVNNTDPNE